MLETFLYNELYHQQDLLWLKQDAETAHAAQISMQVLRTMFLGTLISHCRDSPGLPTCLTFQYQTTSSQSTLKARYMKHVMPKLMT